MTEQSAIEILESISEAIMAIDKEWRYTYVNTAAELVTGHRREELLGQTRLEMFPGIAGTSFDMMFRRAMEERVTVHLEEYYAPSGKWLAETVCPSPGGVVVHVQDITDRKRADEALRKSEERFRRYFELGLIGMALTSRTKRILEVNEEICRILGYERSELLGMTWVELTHQDDRAAEDRFFSRVLAGEINGYSLDKRFIRKDGEVVYATVAIKCLRNADGSVDSFVKFLQDLTERKLAEQKSDAAREALTQSEERLRLALGSSGMAAWSWEIAPDIITSDAHCSVLFGLPAGRFPQKIDGFTGLIHAEERERVRREIAFSVERGAEFKTEFRAALLQRRHPVFGNSRESPLLRQGTTVPADRCVLGCDRRPADGGKSSPRRAAAGGGREVSGSAGSSAGCDAGREPGGRDRPG